MDAFFVSVELRRRPELVGQPVVVGGTGARGVVAAASYEARRYGVHSAMPSAVARRRCPARRVPGGDHELYAAVSRDVREIFDRYTPIVEPLSLDEAFLDVTGSLALFGDGVTIGRSIRGAVRDELDLDCSVGVARNKFLAKLASVEAKPIAHPDRIEPGPGVVSVEPEREQEFLDRLPVSAALGRRAGDARQAATPGGRVVCTTAGDRRRSARGGAGDRAGASSRGARRRA